MHRRAAVFLLLYLAAVVYLSLFPGEFLPRPRPGGLLWYSMSGRRVVLDVALNVLFYLPLGAAAALALPRPMHWAVRWLAAVSLGVAVSYSVENLQLYSARRYASWVDFLSNVAGSAMGAAAGLWAGPRLTIRANSRWFLTRTGALFLVLWCLWQTFPLVPATSLDRFAMAWSRILHPDWPVLAMVQTGIGFLTLAWTMDHRARSPWLVVAFGALLAQGFLLERQLSPALLLAAGAAWAIAWLAPRPKGFWIAGALVAWLAFEEFRPFQTGAANRFEWTPFASWYQIAALSYYPTLFRKLFLYTSVVWWLWAARRSLPVAVAIPAVVLAAGEWAQRYLPGRTPETADLAILAAGSVLLYLVHSRASTC